MTAPTPATAAQSSTAGGTHPQPPTTPDTDGRAAVRQRLAEITALAAVVEGRTPAGRAVLATVQRHLDTAYATLAAYVQRPGQT